MDTNRLRGLPVELHFRAEIAAGDLNAHRCAFCRQFNGDFLGHSQQLPGGDIAVVPGLLAVDRDGDLILVEAVLKNDEQFLHDAPPKSMTSDA